MLSAIIVNMIVLTQSIMRLSAVEMPESAVSTPTPRFKVLRTSSNQYVIGSIFEKEIAHAGNMCTGKTTPQNK